MAASTSTPSALSLRGHIIKAVLFIAGIVTVTGLVIGFAIQRQEPAQSAAAVAPPTRPGEIGVIRPTGGLPEFYGDFDWQPYRGAAHYRLKIQADNGDVLFDRLYETPHISLTAFMAPEKLREAIATRQTIHWRVTAVDQKGAQIADSGPQIFFINTVLD